MRNEYYEKTTQAIYWMHLNSLRIRTPDAQSILGGTNMSLQPPLRGDDLLTPESQVATVSWIWEGMLAAGNITLLTSVWKAGKSSLLALLLAHRHKGGVLLDRIVETGGSAVVSEEPADLWRRRARNLAFGPN